MMQIKPNQKIKYLRLVIQQQAALNAKEKKIPDVNNLVKRSDYDTKTKDIENKYITNTELNKLASDAVNARIVQANLIKKADFDNKLSDLNRKTVSNKTKDISLAKELSYFHGKMKMVIKNMTYFNQFLNT